MIKAIIFDVDGVVFDSVDSKGTFIWNYTIEEDLGITNLHLRKIFAKDNWERVIRGKIDTRQYFQQIFQDEIFQKLNLSPEQFISYWLAKDHNIRLDVLEFIKSLTIPCYLGTNQEKYRTNQIMESVGDHFTEIFSSSQIGSIKPEKEFFQHIQNKLNLTPAELLFIDDTKENINSAKELGWNVYYYQNDLENLEKFICNEPR